MEIVNLGTVDYAIVSDILDDFIQRVQREDKNFLIFATHYPIFTKGYDEKDFPWAYRSDRGGSITYHDQGTLMVYFAFKASNPALFYKKVVKSMKLFFSWIDKDIFYDPKRPGFYKKNLKLASLGFRYKSGVSKHGISIHLDPNLDNFKKIAPCNLEGIEAGSLKALGYDISLLQAKIMVIKAIDATFA